jgi:lantibiotic modifying enzyme
MGPFLKVWNKYDKHKIPKTLLKQINDLKMTYFQENFKIYFNIIIYKLLLKYFENIFEIFQDKHKTIFMSSISFRTIAKLPNWYHSRKA